MDNLINETNQRLQEIIDNLTTIKKEYENKLDTSNKEIEIELGKVRKYKEDFFIAKEKIEKMNSDIEGFEEDYQSLVDRFKDDELANILISANKEISAKIDERKRKIAKDKIEMNELVEKAELSKNKLVKLTAQKRALELCLAKILDAYEFYTKALGQIITYSIDNATNLSACFHEQSEDFKLNFAKQNEVINEDTDDESDNNEVKFIIEDTDEDLDSEDIEEESETENVQEQSSEIEIDEDDDEELIQEEDITIDDDDLEEKTNDDQDDMNVSDEELDIDDDINIDTDDIEIEAIKEEDLELSEEDIATVINLDDSIEVDDDDSNDEANTGKRKGKK